MVKRVIRVSVINVAVDPHPAGTYVKLLRAAAQASSNGVRVWGNRHATFGDFGADPKTGHVIGDILEFTDFDVYGQWLDLRKKAEAAKEDVRQVKIPPNLKPDLKRHRYVMFPEIHRIAIDTTRTSPGRLLRTFEILLTSEEILQRFGIVNVTLEQDRSSLERIWSIPHLRTLRIEVNRPNPDDVASVEKEIRSRLRSQRAKKITEELRADRQESLVPDKGTKALAGVALSNGVVVGIGADDKNHSLKESTADHPAIQTGTFDPAVELRESALLRHARALLSRLGIRFPREGQ